VNLTESSSIQIVPEPKDYDTNAVENSIKSGATLRDLWATLQAGFAKEGTLSIRGYRLDAVKRLGYKLRGSQSDRHP